MIVDGDEGMSYTGSVNNTDFGFYAISAHAGGPSVPTDNDVGSLVYVKYHYDSGTQCLYRVQNSAADNLIYTTSGPKGNSEPTADATTFDSYPNSSLVAEGVVGFKITTVNQSIFP